MCRLKFETEVAGAAVYIDGRQITVGEEIEVAYGAHTLKVVAEGYDDWQKTLIVNSESATIALDLAETEETEASSETEKSIVPEKAELSAFRWKSPLPVTSSVAFSEPASAPFWTKTEFAEGNSQVCVSPIVVGTSFV